MNCWRVPKDARGRDEPIEAIAEEKQKSGEADLGRAVLEVPVETSHGRCRAETRRLTAARKDEEACAHCGSKKRSATKSARIAARSSMKSPSAKIAARAISRSELESPLAHIRRVVAESEKFMELGATSARRSADD